MRVEPAVAIEDVVTAASFDHVSAGAAHDDVAAVERRFTNGKQCGDAVEPGDTGSIEFVADQLSGHSVGTSQYVVEVPTRQTFGQVETVTKLVEVRC